MYAKEFACVAGALLLTAIAHAAGTLSGRWVDVEDDSISLRLEETPDGSVEGTLGGEPRIRLMGRRAGSVLSGTLEVEPGVALPVRAEAKGDRLEFCLIWPERKAAQRRRPLLGSPILPARYFLTAQGFAGFEGGPPLWNLIAIAASAGSAGGGGGGGGDTSWSSRLSSGIDGGDTGAVFLPNGGIVSYGN